MILPRCITENQSLRPLTTIGIGGRAKWLAACCCPDDLRQAVLFARDCQAPLFVLGRGSNLLVQDEDVPAVVVRLAGEFAAVDCSPAGIAAGAGAPLIKLGAALARRGLAGCAFMGVIPGTVGGAVRMNAGIAPGQDMAACLERLRVFDPATMQERWLNCQDLKFSYRCSSLAGSPLIATQAVFRPGSPEPRKGSALADIKSLFDRRRAAQPRTRFTFGSTFKNPPVAEHAAGWYLEQAGMKGMRCGGAMIAAEHANWIVNCGGATAADVRQLIELGRGRVAEQFGLQLEREVIFLPEDLPGHAAA